MATFNKNQFYKEINLSHPNAVKFARQAAQTSFNASKNKLINDFLNDEITQEIEAGPTAENKTNTLDGKGNLFSFIGFEFGSDPITPVVNVLEEKTIISPEPTIEKQGNKFIYNFKVSVPSEEDLSKAAPLPWENGRSWLYGIERGISGFGNYIYWKFLSNPPSRSQHGIQAKNKLRNGVFKKTSYISRILNTFKKKLR